MHSTMDTDRSQSVGAVVTPECNLELPTWLSAPDPTPPARSKPMRELVLVQYESVFPRILEKMYGGSTLQAAIGDDFREIDSGAFLRWIKKDPQRQVLYKEAKEIRTEAWAGKIIEHAIAENTTEDVQRSTLIVNTYKWLMASDNRKAYGESKQIDFGGTISITSALAAAKTRVIENEVIDVLELDNG